MRWLGRAALAACVAHAAPHAAAQPQAAARGAAEHAGLRLMVAGDVLLDRGVRTAVARRGIDRLLDGAAPLFARCDAVCVNLECPVADSGVAIAKRFSFRGDPAWLGALRRAGVTHANCANNHVNDLGRAGVEATLRAAGAAGIAVVGAAARQDSAGNPLLVARGGARVALFASVLLPLENWLYRDDAPGPSQESVDRLAERLQAWKRAHPGDVAVVLLHWGVEHRPRPTDEQRAEACELIDAGADAVVGCHPHVAQGVEWHRGRPIVYSLGNFVFDQRGDEQRRALAAELRVGPSGATELRLHPFRIDDCRPRPMPRGERRAFLASMRERSPDTRFTPRDGCWIAAPARAARQERSGPARAARQ